MKKHRDGFVGIRLGVLFCLPLLAAGCSASSGGGQPPTEAQLQQQNRTILNDPHVPDSIKQHLQDQQSANQAAARGYTADLQQKQTGNKENRQ